MRMIDIQRHRALVEATEHNLELLRREIRKDLNERVENIVQEQRATVGWPSLLLPWSMAAKAKGSQVCETED